jgi:hypothetical protein
MRAPDLNAPRFRYKFRDILTKELIEAFKAKYPQYSDYSTKDLLNAIKVHNLAIADEIMTNRDGVEFQSNLGYSFIGMTAPSKKNKSNIAWGKSVKLGLKVMHKNWDTDNKVGKIFYCNYGNRYRFENRQLWSFSAARPFKRAASESIIKNWRSYVMVDPNQYIWKLFESHRNKEKLVKATKRNLVDYNEFELGD